jgi:hypothetical protein
VGKVAIEAEVLAELQHLISLVKRMIGGETLEATALADFNESDGEAELMSIYDEGKEFVFIHSTSRDSPMDNYIELRSTAYPAMAIALPNPALTKTSSSSVNTMDADSLAKWRDDLC